MAINDEKRGWVGPNWPLHDITFSNLNKFIVCFEMNCFDFQRYVLHQYEVDEIDILLLNIYSSPIN